jgi:hypothetical protein
MHGILRMVAVLLLIAMAAMPAAQAMPFPAAPSGHPGCHGHAPITPVPSPTNYQCCVSGHHAAMPGAAFSIGSMAAERCSLEQSERPNLRFVSFPSAVLAVPNSSPPGATPLRI